MTGQGNGFFYEIIVSQPIKQRIKEFHQQAILNGKGHEFLNSLRIIHRRLQQDPTNFGEPVYRLPALRLLIYHVIVSRVVVDYGVNEEKPLVFLKGVQFLT